MIKLLGVLLIAGSCSAVGFSMNSRLKARVSALKSFLGAIQLFQAEIVFRRTPLPDILPLVERECPGAASAFFRQVHARMAEMGIGFSAAMSQLLPQLRFFELRQDELDWISSVGHIAGRYDAPMQSDRLSVVITRLERSLQQAQEEYGQKGKLYRALGVTVGIMIALVAI